jgi:virginiamycin A acetyltransferase
LTPAWWDWPLSRIAAHIPTIMSGSVEDLTAVAPVAQPEA